jgi:hypothetical protein
MDLTLACSLKIFILANAGIHGTCEQYQLRDKPIPLKLSMDPRVREDDGLSGGGRGCGTGCM